MECPPVGIYKKRALDSRTKTHRSSGPQIEDGAVSLEPDMDVVANRLLLSKDEHPTEGLGPAAAIGRTRGGGTWKVDRSEPVNPQVGSRRALLQRFVEQDAEHQSDVRVYVVGDRVVGAMYRHAPAGE
jgi:hypothetical protein